MTLGVKWSLYITVVYSLVCLLSHFSVGQWHAWFTMSCFNCKCANKWQGVKFCDINLPQKHWQQLLPASQSHGLTHLGGVQGGLHQPAQTPLLPQCDYLWAHSKLLRYPPDVSHQQRARISCHLRLHHSDLPARWHFKVGEEPNKSWHHLISCWIVVEVKKFRKVRKLTARQFWLFDISESDSDHDVWGTLNFN